MREDSGESISLAMAENPLVKTKLSRNKMIPFPFSAENLSIVPVNKKQEEWERGRAYNWEIDLEQFGKVLFVGDFDHCVRGKRVLERNTKNHCDCSIAGSTTENPAESLNESFALQQV
jgi:hypothetical protein